MKYFAAIKEVSYAMIWKDIQNAQEEKNDTEQCYFGVKRRKENKNILGRGVSAHPQGNAVLWVCEAH